ncbi:hypothetical protein P3W85_03055 [Cupriavidus basilensis]|uniref:Uncharacterized protein n=1 Tax=Cupriavidus basilensis TaxID=68895 RepID=A0ABT6AH59_9BURK|nr:hypothetical protein [Cupriavidus basilensis]MDF3831938.1 hypothetical protein [Cupriavidus basilensis]
MNHPEHFITPAIDAGQAAQATRGFGETDVLSALTLPEPGAGLGSGTRPDGAHRRLSQAGRWKGLAGAMAGTAGLWLALGTAPAWAHLAGVFLASFGLYVWAMSRQQD